MSIRTYLQCEPGREGFDPVVQRTLVVDTVAELPTSGLVTGDILICLENGCSYAALSPTTLTPTVTSHTHAQADITSLVADLAGKQPAATGTPTGSKFLRDDNTWQTPAGGGGGASATTVEKDLGSTPARRGRFTITDAGIGATNKLLVWQAPGPYTGKGTRGDEAEMQTVDVVNMEVAEGSAVVTWECRGLTGWRQEFSGGRVNAATTIAQTQPERATPFVLGKMRGNVKFTYLVMT